MYKRDKWEKIKNLISSDIAHAVHYSSDKLYEHNVSLRYLKYMEAIEIEENWYKEYLRYMEQGLS
jgi:hypothetical protein